MRNTRWLLSLLVLVGAAACGDSKTCGRGRCAADARCVNVFTNTRKNDGYSTKQLPNVDGEWWCEAPCPPSMTTCGPLCLSDPADDNVTVCEASSASVIYYAEGSTFDAPVSPFGGACLPGTVTGVSVGTSCEGPNVGARTCPADTDCELGVLSAGQLLPDPTLTMTTVMPVRLCLGGTGQSLRLSSTLPATKPIRVYVTPERLSNCP